MELFDRVFARLSLRRSMAGIYFELRTLRQMAEIWFEEAGLELPSVRRAKSKPTAEEVPVDGSMDEETRAAQELDRITRARLEGRDAGSSYRPDPER